MFSSGGGWSQSIQPMVRFLFGSFGRMRKATVFVPERTSEVTSNSCCV